MSDETITRRSLADVLAAVHRADTRDGSAGTDWDRIDAMTKEEIDAGARNDPDNPPLTDEELAGAIPAPPVLPALFHVLPAPERPLDVDPAPRSVTVSSSAARAGLSIVPVATATVASASVSTSAGSAIATPCISRNASAVEYAVRLFASLNACALVMWYK